MKALSFSEFEESLRHFICELRVQTGFTQKELAKRSEALRQSTIAKFEKGDSPNVTLRTIFEIDRASSVPLSDLIRRAEGDSGRSATDDLWTRVAQDVALLPPTKRTKLSRIVREILRADS